MLLPGTNAEIGVIIIAAVESLMLFFQVIYYFERPNDKSRLLFLILLVFLIQYNLAGSLLPDKRLGIPIIYQYVYTYFTGVSMSMYIIYYFYKAFDLKGMRQIALYGMFIYVALPYVVLFAVPYSITGNFFLYNKLVVVIPSIYAFVVGANLYKALRIKYRDATQNRAEVKEQIVVVSTTFLSWLSLPVVTYIEGTQLLEHGLTNIGFFLLAGSYIRTAIRNSHKEYEELRQAKDRLENINDELTVKVKERTQQLEHAHEQRHNTFVNLVHSTKTPLTLINNYLEDFHPAGQQEDMEVVKSNIAKLIRDVNNLFDLERLNKGMNSYDHQQTTNFTNLVKDQLDAFRKMAVKDGVMISEQLQEDLYVKGDPIALQIIVNNLVENAMKFTDDGDILITLSANEDKVTFDVTDSGDGIPANELSSIFEPYYQVGRRLNNNGIGLGLPMVKLITDALNGSVRAVSPAANNTGTSMTVDLPRYYLSAGETVVEYEAAQLIATDTIVEIPNKPYDHQKATVLIVEDNRNMAAFLVRKLHPKYNVFWAGNGRIAIDQLREYPGMPNLIISDVMMDKMDGLKLAEALKKHPEYSHIPILFLSAKSSETDAQRGLEAGAIDYITKPFNVNVLLLKIDALMEKNINLQRRIVDNMLKMNGNAVRSEQEGLSDVIQKNIRFYQLTPRETDVTKAIIEGNTYKEIA
ncbi:MAG TPA: response regulator, partial [Chitinophaga sp.]|uniref:ATP-binding response regulator n=1 Tax=Chitinophaga sp. TaxID=1869181 RepID=UPI002CEA39AC